MIKMILAIDIGNTNITVGLFRGSRLAAKSKIPTGQGVYYRKRLSQFLKNGKVKAELIEAAVVSSVVPDSLAALSGSLRGLGIRRIMITGKNLKIPIRNLYRNKSEVGQDRLVNAFAASHIYGAPAVVVDFGTAVTFDVVSKYGEYLGGLIMPGIGISLSSLYEKTALLPKVELRDAPDIIAKDTVSSMRGGILFGFGAMCDGLVTRYRKRLGGNMKVIATGGNAALMKKYAPSIRIVDEDLTLKGLHALFLKR